MKFANYSEITELIETGREFKGNSITAKKDNEGYKVHSYNTLIYGVCGDTTYFDNCFYSVTTSKLQNIICGLLSWKPKRTNDKEFYTSRDFADMLYSGDERLKD